MADPVKEIFGTATREHQRLRDAEPLTPSLEDALTEEDLAQGAALYKEQATRARLGLGLGLWLWLYIGLGLWLGLGPGLVLGIGLGAVSTTKSKRGRCLGWTLLIAVVLVLNIIIPCLKVYRERHHLVGPARTYYLEQRPLILAAARRMHLNWYWAQASPDIAALEINAGPLSGGQGSYLGDSYLVYYEGHPYWDVINPPGMYDRYSYVATARFRAMRRNLERHGRDDFKIEKSKCEMTRFMQRNSFPTPPILSIWNTRSLPPQMNATSCDSTTLPLFVKACHLTQGHLHSWFRVKSCDQLPELEIWMGSIFDTVATDPERMWAEDADALTKKLVPGFMLQGGVALSPDHDPLYYSLRPGFTGVPGAARECIFELKCEVLWTRTYFCELVLGERPGPTQLFYLRGPDDDDAVVMDSHALDPGREWVHQEGHLACVWRLAERVARAAAIDQMRVDIFVEKGKPDACMVNENSLSSGSDTWPHRMYVARLWAEGHERHLYTAFSNATGKPSYMQTEADVPTF